MLVVDDEPAVLAVLAELLEHHLGVATLRALDAAEGLRLLGSRRVDAILSDFRMAEMDGSEFLARCATLAPGVPRVLITGHADIPLAKRAINEARVNRMLLKPVKTEELAKIVSELLAEAAASRHRSRAFSRTAALLPDDAPP